MATNFNAQNWLTQRTKEPEFLAFMGVKTAEEAIAVARAQCGSGDAGELSLKEVFKLKDKYLADQCAKMGLPTGMGIF